MTAPGPPPANGLRVALAHDYLTQRGGAERVAAILAEAFPTAPLYTALYDPGSTFPEFAAIDVRPSAANRVGVLRRHHRLAFPIMAPVVSRMRVDADVLLASSSGWAHGIGCTGRTVVYCHAPARWLYQHERYLGPTAGLGPAARFRHAAATGAVGLLGGRLRAWDRQRALAADRYLVNSTVVQQAVGEAYGIAAEVLPPPPAMGPDGPTEAVDGLRRPFLLCVARLLPYKNVAEAIRAVRLLDGPDLVVVGRGPDLDRLLRIIDGDPRIHLLGGVSDPTLRWLYAECSALLAASYEDYGLSPLEAGSFGKPTVALRAGGYLDTIAESVSGLFFDAPEPAEIARAVAAQQDAAWDADAIRTHTETFGKARFLSRIRAVVAEELG